MCLVRKALASVLALVTLSAGAVAASWPTLREHSALSVSYSASVEGTETTLINAYGTISGVGFYRRTAARLVATATSDRARLEAMMNWAHENVRPQYAAPGRIVRDNFYDIVRRGFGFCDQTAHVFATLATYAGYDSRLWFLINDEGVSPHAVAEVLIEGHWVVVDPWQGVVWKSTDGRLATIADATPELLATWGYDRWGVLLHFFTQGKEFRAFPYQSPLAFAQKVVSKVARVPLAPDFASTGLVPVSGRRDAGMAEEDERGGTGVSPRPTTSFPDSVRAVLLRYDEARRAHLETDYDRAITLYEELLATEVRPDLRHTIAFFSGLALLRAGKPTEAIAAWDDAERQGIGDWIKSLLQYRGEAKEMIGDVAGARADYARADTPPAALRLARLGAARNP